MNRLRELRLSKNLSTIELGRLLQLDPSMLTHIEKGRKNFSLESLSRACEFFGVSADYMLGKSPEEMLDDFADSLRNDFVTEELHDDGDVTRSVSDSVPEPARTKIQLILTLRSVNDPALLSAAQTFLRYADAPFDFADDPATKQYAESRTRKMADVVSALGGLSDETLDLLLQTISLRRGD